MATISGATLTIANLNNTTVTATVKYTLTPNAIEKLAGTVFSENVQLIGDDPGVASDIVVSGFPGQAFAVAGGTVNVPRTRTRNVLKSALNEDPGFEGTGAEQADGIFARISLTYAANALIPPALPGPATTNKIAGAWK